MFSSQEGISIVVPVHNEEDSLPQLLQEFKEVLPNLNIPYELIFIDDGSKDNSRKILEHEKELKLKLIIHKEKKGYGASLKEGIELSCYDYVSFLDSDCTHHPALILDALNVINSYHALIGIRDEKSEIFPLSGKIVRFFISSLFSFLFRRKVRDINSGFRIIDKNRFKKYLKLLPDTFSFSASLTLIMLLEKMPLKYISIESRKRKGYSKVKRTTYSFQFIKCLILTYIRWLREKLSK